MHKHIQADVSYVEYQWKKQVLSSWLGYAEGCVRAGVRTWSVMYRGGWWESEVVMEKVVGELEEMEEG